MILIKTSNHETFIIHSSLKVLTNLKEKLHQLLFFLWKKVSDWDSQQNPRRQTVPFFFCHFFSVLDFSHKPRPWKAVHNRPFNFRVTMFLGCMQLQLRQLHWPHLSTISHNIKDLNPKQQHQTQLKIQHTSSVVSITKQRTVPLVNYICVCYLFSQISALLCRCHMCCHI